MRLLLLTAQSVDDAWSMRGAAYFSQATEEGAEYVRSRMTSTAAGWPVPAGSVHVTSDVEVGEKYA